MKYRTLGDTDLKLSVVTFGAGEWAGCGPEIEQNKVKAIKSFTIFATLIQDSPGVWSGIERKDCRRSHTQDLPAKRDTLATTGRAGYSKEVHRKSKKQLGEEITSTIKYRR
ncbi:MAG: hypothetical protein U5K69_09370 [Balneolaceae bacterium]|nr:hypothetical protein [Balneolaceae bacterium]